MASSAFRSWGIVPLVLVFCLFFASPVDAFGAGYVSRGSAQKGTNFRHGDILNSVYFLQQAHSILVKQIYFGNWLRDFSQLIDRKSLEVVPEPILRAIVAIFAYVQFGYTTKEFEVTSERLGSYRPEEHIDNPRGYEGGSHSKLREQVQDEELKIAASGMKNYVANQEVAHLNDTSLDYIEKELVAAIACGRASDPEAYVHLGAALHTLEDFVAHSNWVELCMQMIGRDEEHKGGAAVGLANVFAFVGKAATIETKRGIAPPLVTGTFGSLDLYQTLLGEVEDKLAAMSLPGLQLRMKGPQDSISAASKALISLLGSEGSSFSNDILSITKSATQKPADWGKLNQTPELLWEQLYPVFRLRDKIVRWVYEHMTVQVIADAIAAISTALDKLVYLIIGTFLGPVFQDVAGALRHQSEELLKQDQVIRLQQGEYSIFDEKSAATDPTHSQLCKDHYDHDLNEIAGRVASKITTFTLKRIAEVWQPGNTTDVRPALTSILQALHHPYNYSKDSPIQTLMIAEVIDWCTKCQLMDPQGFANLLERLDVKYMATKLGEEAEVIQHSHKPFMTVAHAGPNQIGSVLAHDLTTLTPTREDDPFVKAVTQNIEKNLKEGVFKGLSMDDFPEIKKLLGGTPSSDTPNPIDHALMKIPGMKMSSVFEGIESNDIVAAPNMGIILKDAVISMRLSDKEWVAKEQQQAQERLGQLEDRPVKEMLELLDINPKMSLTEDIEPENDSKTRKLLNKLKIGSN